MRLCGREELERIVEDERRTQEKKVRELRTELAAREGRSCRARELLEERDRLELRNSQVHLHRDGKDQEQVAETVTTAVVDAVKKERMRLRRFAAVKWVYCKIS